MKAIFVLALVEMAKAATFVTCSKADPDCTKASRLGSEDAACVKREVVYVYNIYNPNYLNALEADPELKADTTVFRCVTVTQKDDLLRISGIENQKTTVQAVYTYLASVKESTKETSSKAGMLTASMIATISLMSQF